MKTKIRTGSPNIECTVNVWSDEAREAAAEARARSSVHRAAVGKTKASVLSQQAIAATRAASREEGGGSQRAAKLAHKKAAKAHLAEGNLKAASGHVFYAQAHRDVGDSSLSQRAIQASDAAGGDFTPRV